MICGLFFDWTSFKQSTGCLAVQQKHLQKAATQYSLPKFIVNRSKTNLSLNAYRVIDFQFGNLP